MKKILILAYLLTHTLITNGEVFNTSDVESLLKIDIENDKYDGLNWDFEQDPLLFRGVKWTIKYIDDIETRCVELIDVTNCGLEGELDIRGLFYLKELYCENNGIDSIIFSENQFLEMRVINCAKNSLRSFPLYEFQYLSLVDISNNFIDSLSGVSDSDYPVNWCLKMYVVAFENYLNWKSAKRLQSMPNVLAMPQKIKPIPFQKDDSLIKSASINDLKNSLANTSISKIQLYSLEGALIDQCTDANMINLSKSGIYIVKATTQTGITTSQKVVLR